MKKILIMLFLLFSMVAFTETVPTGPSASITTIYNEMGVQRPKFTSPIAQSLVDDYSRMIYEYAYEMYSSSQTSSEINRISAKYAKKADAFAVRVEKELPNVPEKERSKVAEYMLNIGSLVGGN